MKPDTTIDFKEENHKGKFEAVRRHQNTWINFKGKTKRLKTFNSGVT